MSNEGSRTASRPLSFQTPAGAGAISIVQLLANCLAKRKSLDAGCDVAILVSDQRIVGTATSSDPIIVSGGRPTIRPIADDFPPGIIRRTEAAVAVA